MIEGRFVSRNGGVLGVWKNTFHGVGLGAYTLRLRNTIGLFLQKNRKGDRADHLCGKGESIYNDKHIGVAGVFHKTGPTVGIDGAVFADIR